MKPVLADQPEASDGASALPPCDVSKPAPVAWRWPVTPAARASLFTWRRDGLRCAACNDPVNQQKDTGREQDVNPAWRLEGDSGHCPYDEHHDGGNESEIHWN